MAKSAKKKPPSRPRAVKTRKGGPKTAAHATEPFGIEFDPATQLRASKSAAPLPLSTALSLHASPEVLNRLWHIIEDRKHADPTVSHSARLLAKGAPRIAQKLGEEAVECLIEVIAGNRSGTVSESADLLYHLLVTWVHAGIRPEEIWQELENRESVSHLIEGPKGPIKRLLGSVKVGTTKIP